MEYSQCTNSELRRIVETLKNDYETTKSSIEALCQKLEDLEKEYAKVATELDKRNVL